MPETKEKEFVEEIDKEEKEDQDGKENNPGEKGDDNKDSKGGETGKTFTQSQVSKMMTREKNQGRNAAYKELGIDPKDSKTIAMFKAFVASQKTDEEKAAEEEANNQAKMNEAEQRAQVAEAKAEAMMLGVKPQYVDDVVTLALSRMTDDSDLKTIIGEFKTKYSVWFGISEEDDEKGKKEEKAGQKGTGSSIKNSNKENKGEEKGLGARLAAQRRTGSKKVSYWGNNK